MFEIMDRSGWFKVTEDIFRSWAGRRRLSGVEYHGPIFYFLSDEPARNARACSCETCQGSRHVSYRLSWAR